ncbi:hypothetical protein C7S20_14290 [Christiangramia fulva]|uniref:Secreted protein n=1 Tax=Christiangramia fulva TaxID=2126553 RepID=A0A2R3Z7V4_9FLAO|nr:hypothetical protein [Christiangramia fulva]AVR46339.1 hypothetical protein C7S20_14290 [Christiangramia fulva]
MKYLFLGILLIACAGIYAQELPKTIPTGPIIKAEENKTGFPILKKEETETESRFLRDKPKAIDLRENPNNLLTAGDAIKEKWDKDKAAKEEYRNDQSLGNVVTTGKFVEVYCRDHEYVDGDRVKVIVNGQVVNPNLTLEGGFTPIMVVLQDGFNSIEFVALNQGTSGPNTAELRVVNTKGEQVAKKEWNLLTGAKAQLIVVKN